MNGICSVVTSSDCWTVKVEGELDSATAPELTGAMSELDLSDGHAVAIDLGGCTFIDSSGIHALVAAATVAKGAGKRLTVRAVSSNARRVLEICSLANGEVFDLG
jgi:anti-sigma B factor antagonist